MAAIGKKKKFVVDRGFPINETMRALKREVKRFKTPIVTQMAERKDTPYKILISTLLSLRTQDRHTAEASARLFELAETPEAMIKVSAKAIEKAIYPVGFYRTKARTILEISATLLQRHGGRPPDTVEALTSLKGVGRKTANLVVTHGYGKPGICVDTHVHRIANRWGYVKTRTPDETEMALRDVLPKRHWIVINDLLVTYGQNLCKPVSPLCSKCRLKPHCARRGVGRSR